MKVHLQSKENKDISSLNKSLHNIQHKLLKDKENTSNKSNGIVTISIKEKELTREFGKLSLDERRRQERAKEEEQKLKL